MTSVKVTVHVEDSERHKVGSTVVDVPLRSKTLFGCAVTPYPGSGRDWVGEINAHIDDCGYPRILRSYDGGQPATWQTRSTAPGSQIPAWPYGGIRECASWHSIKPDVVKLASGQLDGWAKSYVESIPRDGYPKLLTVWHEPEAKVGKLFSARDWKRAVHRFGRIVRQVNHPDVKYGPVFMSRFTLAGKPNYVKEILASDSSDLWEICDFVGWDPYNESTKKPEGSISTYPEYYLDDLVNFTKSTGLPMAVGETGFIPVPGLNSLRPEWLGILADYAEQHDFLACCYFDASISNPWWLRIFPDGTRDQASIDAWSEVYRR